jgi:uncharacterized protein
MLFNRTAQSQLVCMLFYVYAQDRPAVGAEMLAMVEAHWSYMDKFADQLVLRGPTLSDDGEEHTGSLHIVDLADRAGAERFATKEPFYRAGLYDKVTVVRAVVLLHRERPEDSTESEIPKALVTGEWPPTPRKANDTGPQLLGVSPDAHLSFVAILVDDDQSHTIGIASIVSAPRVEAPRIVQPCADQLTGVPAALTAKRWQHGGRS